MVCANGKQTKTELNPVLSEILAATFNLKKQQ